MHRRSVLKSSLAMFALSPVFGCVDRSISAPRASAGRDLIDEAFFYSFPLYEFSRTTAARTVRRPRNVLHGRGELLDHTARGTTAPNSDTIYSPAFLELSGGPVEVIVPDAPDRYFCVPFMNAFTDNFAVLGTRTTGGRGGRYWIAGPEWTGQPPAGVELIRSDTNDVWMLARFLVDGSDDLEAARAVQSRLRVVPVPGRGPVRNLRMAPLTAGSPSHFLDVVNELLGRSPVTLGEARRADRFRAVGIRPGEYGVWDKLPAETRDEWSARFPEMLSRLSSDASYLMPERNGWRAAPAQVGNYGENDALRAGVARWMLAALPSEEATYFRAIVDSVGNPLNGKNTYRFTIPAEGVPVDAFWSMTMYQEAGDGRFYMIENPIPRYAIGDRTPDLVRQPDGSVLISVQAEAPNGVLANNWLPAPAGPFMLFFRAYIPRPEILEGRWSPPALVRSDPA